MCSLVELASLPDVKRSGYFFLQKRTMRFESSPPITWEAMAVVNARMHLFSGSNSNVVRCVVEDFFAY